MQFYKFVQFSVLAFSIFIHPSISWAQDCEGPPEMCLQIQELNSQVEELKSSNEQIRFSTKKDEDEDVSEKMARSIAFAGAIAVLLKMTTSALRGWKGRVHSDKDKAKIKIAMLVVGVLTFLATNVGAGLPWWQALVIAGGGPGSIAVHEIMKLVPVLKGKKRMPVSDPPPDMG